MQGRSISRLHVAALLLCLAQSAQAEDVPANFPDLVIEDVKHIVTAPAHWQEDEWHRAGWSALAVVSTAVLIDRPLQDEMRRHAPNQDSFMLQVERFGSQYAVGVVGGFYLVGSLSDNENAVQVAQDGLTASLIASGLITPTIKLAAGRARPRENAGIYHFKPLSNLNASFPSGHTTEAFALASVIADHYEETWIACTAYSVAGLVGIARSYHDAHFASDILAGAMIGTWVGKSVVDYNRRYRSGGVALLPEVAPGVLGLRLAGNF